MKRDDMNIDEILKRHLPHAPQEDIDEAGDTVLKRIRGLRFQGESAATKEGHEIADSAWLQDFHVALLLAVDELGGYGHPVSITLRMQDIMNELVWGKAVFMVLILFERMEMVSSSAMNPEKPKELDQRYYTLTELGRETLKQALAIRKNAVNRVRWPRFA